MTPRVDEAGTYPGRAPGPYVAWYEDHSAVRYRLTAINLGRGWGGRSNGLPLENERRRAVSGDEQTIEAELREAAGRRLGVQRKRKPS